MSGRWHPAFRAQLDYVFIDFLCLWQLILGAQLSIALAQFHAISAGDTSPDTCLSRHAAALPLKTAMSLLSGGLTRTASTYFW